MDLILKLKSAIACELC